MSVLMQRLFTGFVLSSIFLLVFFCLPPYVLSLLLGAVLFESIIVELPRMLGPKMWYFWVVLPIYPVLPFILFILLNQNPMYRMLILWLVGLVAFHDTGSYVIGNLLGRHKIAPRISPAKTWEGFIGGTIITLLMMLVIYLYWAIPTSIMFFSLTIIMACVISFLGDLFESFLKRRARLKDSAGILPGHGGFLDRLDGILFTSYFFYILKDFLVQIFNV